ncbi:MAG: hypothetical protein OHK006_05270 [Thermodesulfovibrionales bacterium]
MPSLGEQLVYLAEIENISGQQIQCNFIILKAFDPAGGLVDLFYLGGGRFGLNETRKKSGLFPIRPDCIDRMHSLTVESRCSVREGL